jgi:ABC-type sugar transport system substrate-binding protein
MSFKNTLAGAAFGLALSFAALSGAQAQTDLSGKRIIFVACGPSNPWCKVFNERLVGLLRETKADVKVLENDLDPVQVNQQMAQAVSERPDMIIVLPADDKSLVASVKRAKAAGVAVVYLDSPAGPEVIDDIAINVIADNYALVKFAGENIVAGLKAQGKTEANVISITGSAGTAMVTDRQQGFIDALAATPEYRIVETHATNWDPVASGQIAQQLFAKYANQGGIQAARADADYMAIPIIEAARQAGLAIGGADGLIVSGSTCTPEGIAAIRSGDMIGTASADAWTQGEATAGAAIRFLAGETLDKVIMVPEYRITAANVEEFAEVCSK